MKISLKWLKDYVSPGISPEKLAYRLTMAGLEVEKIFSAGGDTVFELEITPNRPDCLSMLGMARETAAILKKLRKFPAIKKRVWPKQKCSIEIDDKKACSRYIGTLIEGVSIKKAQEKVIKYLTILGMRPINNVVDITNFCLMETGQPLHAFDYDKLAGGKIIVRRARKGEKITTIDDAERELDPSILVIADQKRAVAIAGVMGGKDTEVTERTKNILLESAYFDPILIRRASRKLGLSSDSSYRFERGVDYKTVEAGAARAIDLILQSAQGKITKRSDVIVAKKKAHQERITISKDTINKRIGAVFSAARYRDILKRLDFSVTSSKTGTFKIAPPSFREDIKADEDIVEEVARIIGYDNLPLSFPQVKASAILPDPKRIARRKTRDLLLAQGFNEVITYTMISRKDLKRSNQEDIQSVEIFNPLTQDQDIMRPSMLPSLLTIVLSNVNRGQKNIRFFETGKIYTKKEEKDVLGIIITGVRGNDWRQTKKEDEDYYDLKGSLEQVLDRLGVQKTKVQFKSDQKKFFTVGQSASVFIEGKKAGVIGKVEDNVLDRWDIKQKNVLFAQVDMDDVYARKKQQLKYKPVSEFPSVSRDISLAVQPHVTAHDIERAIRATVEYDKQVILTELKFIEKYEGEKISKKQRGLIFSLRYQSRLARTLRDEEVTEAHEKVCDVLVKELGVIRR
ncbi:MAG: phenylalanine--tRNA ligase subunit beta [Candidatus Omnitrophica bacterium]|nr:phenylalanine--tRNA ligase subunit beta [Candidatus Omnitrophota bacterium]